MYALLGHIGLCIFAGIGIYTVANLVVIGLNTLNKR